MKSIGLLLGIILPEFVIPYTHNWVRVSPLRIAQLGRSSRLFKSVAISSHKSTDIINGLDRPAEESVPLLQNPSDIENISLDKNAQPEELDAPDLKKILLFALPAIGVWLCNPLLSLIDTSCVGLYSGTLQQAALNPATAVTDYGALLAVRYRMNDRPILS